MKLFSNKKDCCGCTACKSICPKKAIDMHEDEEGFLYPKVDKNKCIECGLCINVCPFKVEDDYDNQNDFFETEVFAVKNKSNEIRMTSTSGGMFVPISDAILDKDGVVYGAIFDENLKVCHSRATSKNKRDKMKGSKYVQSNLKDMYFKVKADLAEGKYVLFTGTPCQTAGLYKFLSNIDKSKLYVCDIICHGTPSPKMWKEYIKFIEEKYRDKVSIVKFRDKKKSWRLPNIEIDMKIKSYVKEWGKDYYHELVFEHYIIRPSCHNCKYTNFHRKSDITIGDFWGIEECKEHMDDDKGISLVLVNTNKGKQLFDEISDNIIYERSNVIECMQPNLKEPSKANRRREEFWSDYYKKGFIYILKKYQHYGVRNKIKRLIKRILNKK